MIGFAFFGRFATAVFSTVIGKLGGDKPILPLPEHQQLPSDSPARHPAYALHGMML